MVTAVSLEIWHFVSLYLLKEQLNTFVVISQAREDHHGGPQEPVIMNWLTELLSNVRGNISQTSKPTEIISLVETHNHRDVQESSESSEARGA